MAGWLKNSLDMDMADRELEAVKIAIENDLKTVVQDFRKELEKLHNQNSELVD